MTPHTAQPKGSQGFTLIELLIVMGIIAVLASMLLPAMFAVRVQANVTNTESLLKRIDVALNIYSRLYTHYPPDCIGIAPPPTPEVYEIYNFQGTRSAGSYVKVALTAPAYPPEALYYFLCHRFLSAEHPMLSVRQGVEALDTNQNGVPEVVDSWGWPILYNRRRFPACAAGEYNFGVTGSNPDGNPLHNAETFDIYSVGPDGQTGDDELPPFSDRTFVEFCTKAVNDPNDGHKDDDIRNWKK
ncbi:MAG TPA: prepilin-type N-terminal cleavage/methylation domain-containing protein [Planctomycetota bacterium]|nr:prepilin-type N-terminal cleavage/methylation domain-containing protein [Planctomycetota bacterium]